MKYLFFPILALFLLASTLTYSQVSFQTGKFAASEGTPGYTLDKGSGDRIFMVEIKFEKPFTTKPDVHLNITLVDGDKTGDVKYDISPSFITDEGFTIKIKTFGEGKIHSIGGTWFAITE